MKILKKCDFVKPSYTILYFPTTESPSPSPHHHFFKMSSFSSILHQIKRKPPSGSTSSSSQAQPSLKPQQSTHQQGQNTNKANSSQPHLPPRKADPAVERLKELRRQEREVKEAALAAKKKIENSAKRPTATSRSKSSSIASSRHGTDSRRAQHSNDSATTRSRPASPVKRLTFAELMKQGQEKTKNLKETVKESPTPLTEHKFQSKTRPVTSASSNNSFSKSKGTTASATASSRDVLAKPKHRSKYVIQKSPKPKPKPLAQPSPKLKAKLEARKLQQSNIRRSSKSYRDEDEYDSTEDDFIVDDEEEVEDVDDTGYDRDEIWRMFNKGKTRHSYNDYEDDLSDMEADGESILEEEERAAKRARIEEKREMEIERRRIEEKKKRLGKR